MCTQARQDIRRLRQRMKEHNDSADFDSSALAENAWLSGHPVDWENVSLVSSCP